QLIGSAREGDSDSGLLFQVVEFHAEIKFSRRTGDSVGRVDGYSIYKTSTIGWWTGESIELDDGSLRQVSHSNYGRWTSDCSRGSRDHSLICLAVIGHNGAV